MSKPSNAPPAKASKLQLIILTCLAVAAAGIGIVRFVRREVTREAFLLAQPTEVLKAMSVQTDPDALNLLVMAQRLEKETGKESAYKPAVRAALLLTSNDSQALHLRTLTYAARLAALFGVESETESLLKSAEAIGGSADSNYYLARGILARRRQQLGSSVTEFREAVRLQPQNAEAWSRLGASYTLLGQPEDAVAALEQGVKLTPNDPQAHASLADSLGDAGQYTLSDSEEAAAAALAPEQSEFAVLPAVGHAYHARTDVQYQTAAAELIRLRIRFPQASKLTEVLAGLYMRAGQYASARQELQRLTTERPRDSELWLNLAISCMRCGEQAEAQKAFARQTKLMQLKERTVGLTQRAFLHQDDPKIYRELSDALYESGDIANSVGAMQHAAQLAPDDAKIQQAMRQLQNKLSALKDSSITLSPVQQ